MDRYFVKIKIKRKCPCGYLYEKIADTSNNDKFMKGQMEFVRLVCPKCQIRFIKDGKIIL